MSKQQYDNTDKGVLFKNDRRESESHPNYKGSLNVEGREFWLSGWIKKNEDGSFKLVSLSVQPKEAKPERAQQARREAFQEPSKRNRFDNDFQDDDIGF